MNKLNAMILNCADNSSLYFNVNYVRETVWILMQMSAVS